MGFLYSLLKTSLLIVSVLVLSQLPIGKKRICDHVGDFIAKNPIDLKTPSLWIAKNFNFTENAKARKIKEPTELLRSVGSLDDISNQDRKRLSAIFKQDD